MSSIARLIEGLTTEESVLQAVAPDTTARDRAVWEAAKIFNRGDWRPKIDVAADNGHDFVGLGEERVKELMKSLVVALMDVKDASTVREIIQAMLQQAQTPEEFLFCMVVLSNFAGQSGIQFFSNAEEP